MCCNSASPLPCRALLNHTTNANEGLATILAFVLKVMRFSAFWENCQNLFKLHHCCIFKLAHDGSEAMTTIFKGFNASTLYQFVRSECYH
eukprot:202229-Amphidinium_carterae.1